MEALNSNAAINNNRMSQEFETLRKDLKRIITTIAEVECSDPLSYHFGDLDAIKHARRVLGKIAYDSPNDVNTMNFCVNLLDMMNQQYDKVLSDVLHDLYEEVDLLLEKNRELILTRS